jgi:ATP-dependent DNA ligase
MLWRNPTKGRPPGFIDPCIPTRATKPPVGPQWIHEIKHDGYRLIARKEDGRVRLFKVPVNQHGQLIAQRRD